MPIRQIMNFVKAKHSEINARVTPESAIYAFIEYVRETTEGKIGIVEILSKSPTGVELMIDCLGCTVKSGDPDTLYIAAGEESNPHDVVHFEGYIIKGKITPHGSVNKEDYEPPQCESCGVSCVSAAMADSSLTGEDRLMCNHCRTYLEGIDSDKAGSVSVCQRCTKYDCSHHEKSTYLVQRSRESDQKIDQYRIRHVK